MNISKKIISTSFLLTSLLSFTSSAVPFINCPTLMPLPITEFGPGAMVPINNTVNAFDIAMNTTILTAINLSSANMTKAIGDNNMSLMRAVITMSQKKDKDNMEIDKGFKDLKTSYDERLANDMAKSNSKLFPGDPVKDKSGAVISEPGSPTYEYVKNMCTMGKMHQISTSKLIKVNSLRTHNGRNQMLAHSLEAVSSVMAASKDNVDTHFELFCSVEDRDSGLCDSVSAAPNADISAFNFFYPVGQKDQNMGATASYRTLYTYNQVESFGAFQYIKNLTGYIGISPPSSDEVLLISKATFVGRYKQLMASMSLVSDAMLAVSSLREAVNSSGVVMSEMDVMNYQIEQSNNPDQVLVDNSASENGKRLTIVRHMAINNKLRYWALLQENARRNITAANLAINGITQSR
jgi:hypothetical protein